MFELILVDEKDNVIGYDEKMNAHLKGKLHRAFSVFIWDQTEKKLLLQKRAAEKYHSGGKWSNSCCSHPYRDETLEDAVQRCILDEFGIHVDPVNRMQCLGKFIYKSDYNGIYEHEIDNVIVLLADKAEFPETSFRKSEIAELKWVSLDELNELYTAASDEFSSWFAQAYQLFLRKGPFDIRSLFLSYLQDLYDSQMWMSSGLYDKIASKIRANKIPNEALFLNREQFIAYIKSKSTFTFMHFERQIEAIKEFSDYYHFLKMYFPLHRDCTIELTCRYKFQRLVGEYRVYISAYYSGVYKEGKYSSPYSCKVKAENDRLVIPVHFETEDMYLVDIFYCHEEQELPFFSGAVYAVENDLYELTPYKADLHIHTTYSDGIEAPEFVVASAIECGMDVIAITDHNNFQGSIVAEEFVRKNKLDVTVIRGEEYSLAFSPMHIIALGTTAPVDRKYIFNDADTTPEAQQLQLELLKTSLSCDRKAYICTQVLLDQVKQMGGVTFLAHPFWKPINPKGNRMDTPESLFIELAKDKRFTGIECVSGSPDKKCSISNLQMALATEILGDLHSIPLIGITDSHSYSRDMISGKHFTIIFASDKNTGNVLDALQSGRCVAVEMVNNEPLCYGTYRLVKLAQFLVRYYFKEHDEAALLRGKMIKQKYLTINAEVK